MDSDDQLFDKIIEFKMMAKQFSKESAKAAAKQKTLMGKIKLQLRRTTLSKPSPTLRRLCVAKPTHRGTKRLAQKLTQFTRTGLQDKAANAKHV